MFWIMFWGSTPTKWFFVYQIPVWVGIQKCWFLRRGENQSTRRKTSQSKGENQEQTQLTYGVDAGILTPGHIGGRRALSPLRYPLFPEISFKDTLTSCFRITWFNTDSHKRNV